jgi:hypothetical protein
MSYGFGVQEVPLIAENPSKRRQLAVEHAPIEIAVWAKSAEQGVELAEEGPLTSGSSTTASTARPRSTRSARSVVNATRSRTAAGVVELAAARSPREQLSMRCSECLSGSSDGP